MFNFFVIEIDGGGGGPQPTGLGTIGEGGGLGPFAGLSLAVGNVMEKFTGAISAIIGFLTVVAGLYFIFQFMIGAIQWLASGGEKAGLAAAQQKLSNSFIGLILVIAAVAIISLLGTFLGFEILNPAKFLKLIKFQ